MYTDRDPGDSTTVIKMFREFNSFLEKSPTLPRLNRDSSIYTLTEGDQSSSSHSNFSFPILDNSRRSCRSLQVNNNNKKSFSSSDLMEDKSTRKRKTMLTLSVDEKAELIAAKSKAAKLEVQLKSNDCERKKSEIEDEKRRKLRSDKFAKDQEEIDVLRRKYKQLLEQKEEAVEELAASEKSRNELKSQLNSTIQELQKENVSVKNRLEEFQCGIDEEYDDLKAEYEKASCRYDSCKRRLDEVEAELDRSKNSVEEMKEIVSTFNEVQSRCVLSEGKVKHLEQKLLQKDETYLVVQKSHEQLVNYQHLERENKKLREDNNLYRDSASNSLILEEKIGTLNSKLAKADVVKEKVEQLEYENEKLLEKLSKWEAPDTDGMNVKARSPSNLTRIIGELQTTQLDLTGKNTQLQTRSTLTDSLLERKQDECVHLLKQFRSVTSLNEQLEDRNQKLKRRLTLLTTERDGLRHVLSSYENDEGAGNKIHLQQAEEKVTLYNQQIKVLEDDLASARKEAVAQETSFLELKQEYEKLKASQDCSPEKIEALVEAKEYKEKFEEWKTKYEELNEEKEMLELRIEKRELQGDYDRRKTKVLHFKYNPYEAATEAYMKKMNDIVEENVKMRKKIIQLQTASREEAEESMNVSRLIKSSKPMEEAHSQIIEWQTKYKRLQEGYEKTAKNFMIAVKNLLGYKLKEEKENSYRLTSIYSSNPDNFFMLRCTRQKDQSIETSVVQTEFLNHWSHLLEKYMNSDSEDPIPAFLAAVNLELHNMANK